MKILAIVGRVFLMAVLFATGVGKALDVTGFADVIVSYDVLPSALALPAAFAMIATELSLAIWLLSGIRLDRAALFAAALHVVFIAWASIALLRGLAIENCGCFGVFYARPLTGWTIVEDLVMVAIAMGTFTVARYRRPTASELPTPDAQPQPSP